MKKETPYRVDDLPNVNINSLTQEQRKVLEVFTETYTKILAGKSPPQFLLNIDGTAGCGKTYLISAICQELCRMARENDQPDPIRVVAPSGVAALNISGRTIHSAFSLPINNDFVRLTGSRLANHQLLWEGVQFVIFDEKSMIGARTLAQVDWRSRQLCPRAADKPFSNLNIALVGDFAQLPPVGDSPLYAPPSETANDVVRHGSGLYNLFNESHRLQTVHRQSSNSPEQIQFRDLLRHASEGGLSQDEWRTLLTRSENKLSPAVKAQFEDAMCLSTTRSEVEAVNLSHLVALNQPCAHIMARHDGGSAAAKVEADKAGGLESYVVLARGAKVMFTRNIYQELGLEISKAFSGFCLQVLNFAIILNLGLVNATTGILEDIIWAPDFTRSELPIVALVSCPTYTGPTL